MGLTKEQNIKKVWGSHIPLLSAVLEILKPKTAVECGCGNYSTPLLASACNLISIEHDCDWGNKINEQFPEVEFIIDAIPLCERRFLKEGELDKIEALYSSYISKLNPFDLLFVDTVACARVVAFNTLRNLTQWIIVHDTDPASCDHYNYDLLNSQGLFHYRLMPDGNVNGHKIEWTSFYTSLPIPYKLIKNTIDKYAIELWGFTSIFEKI